MMYLSGLLLQAKDCSAMAVPDSSPESIQVSEVMANEPTQSFEFGNSYALEIAVQFQMRCHDGIATTERTVDCKVADHATWTESPSTDKKYRQKSCK
jgi:hypothetical protein